MGSKELVHEFVDEIQSYLESHDHEILNLACILTRAFHGLHSSASQTLIGFEKEASNESAI